MLLTQQNQRWNKAYDLQHPYKIYRVLAPELWYRLHLVQNLLYVELTENIFPCFPSQMPSIL